MPRPLIRAAPVLLAGVLGGCSVGSDEEPKPVRGAPASIVQVVSVLERATARHDWRSICEDVFTASARVRAGGGDCPELLRSTASDIRRPSIRPLSIKIRGERAEVHVSTRTAAQAPVEETIVLVREGGEYRVESLGG